MIKVKHLRKTFGSFIAVNDLSFDVYPGDILGFLGPNGAGKSTTMKMITGFLTPDAGTVQVYDYKMVSQARQAKKLMGYLPEGAPCYGDMTTLHFLNFIATVRGFFGAEQKRRVDQVIEQLDLTSVLHRPIDALSKGFKRRVGLAQAILHDPKILILDEPTDGLDPNQKHQVRELIRHLAKDKIVVVSTHILEEVSAVCTRAMIIAHGRLLADSTPHELAAQSRYAGAIHVKFSVGVRAFSTLTQTPQIADIERRDTTGQELILLPQPGVQLLPIFNRLVEQYRWPIEQLSVEEGRLDEVFRRLTATSSAVSEISE